jgi:hypothetical protein
LPLSSLGYFGVYTDSENNKKSEEMNKLVDEYNKNINTFDTKDENDNYCKSINNDINEILKTIIL